MNWIIQLNDHSAEAAIVWSRDFLGAYDTTSLKSLRIDRGRGRTRGVYGRCYYATQANPLHRISCQVPGPFPTRILTRRSPVYRREDGTWPPIPKGCLPGLKFTDPRTGRAWTRVIGITWVTDINEAIIWIVAHESFHFLRRTRQIPGRNTEIEADRFADSRLAEFQSSYALAS